MSKKSSVPSAHTERNLGAALELLDKVDRDLAELQTEEAIVWRAGTVALLVGGLALGGIAALAILAPLVHRLLNHPQSEENAADSHVAREPISEDVYVEQPPAEAGTVL